MEIQSNGRTHRLYPLQGVDSASNHRGPQHITTPWWHRKGAGIPTGELRGWNVVATGGSAARKRHSGPRSGCGGASRRALGSFLDESLSCWYVARFSSPSAPFRRGRSGGADHRRQCPSAWGMEQPVSVDRAVPHGPHAGFRPAHRTAPSPHHGTDPPGFSPS